MADMKQKGLTSEISQEMVEMTQPLLFNPQSVDLSPNHVEQRQQMRDDVVIDIEKTIQDTKEGLLSPTRCIYRVPPRIRKLKEDAYTPTAVSIGPFHYGDERLQDMEKHKQVLLKRFTQEARASLDEMVSLVKHLEPKVRASYLENIELTEKELVKLILVDAAFFIEYLKSNYTGEIQKDAKLSAKHLRETIAKDLLLLENQLPFFLIDSLFNLAFPVNHRDNLPSILDLTFLYFSPLNNQDLEPNPNDRIKHFTDLLRLFYLPRTEHKRHSLEGGDYLRYSANDLQEAGVKFKESPSRCLLDLKFSGCVLEIPQIWVDNRTESFFRNMIALEHCHYPYESYIIDYVVVMDRLINTNKDVDVLIYKK